MVVNPALTASRCSACERASLPARATCPDCWAETAPLELSGAGEIETCTVVHRPPPGFEAPYAVAYIALVEGVRVFAPIRGIDPEAVRPGQRVQIAAGREDEPPFWFTPVEEQ